MSISTLVIGCIIFAAMALAVRHIIRERKSGGCGCGCANCSAHCHTGEQKK